MHRDHDSIFGDTYEGVPNPRVFHNHPYPTRFHGSVNTTPRFMLPYRSNSWTTATSGLGEDGAVGNVFGVAYRLASLAGATTGAYHGYKRNNGSVGWAIGWFLLGGLLPFITIPLSLAEGYGKPRSGK